MITEYSDSLSATNTSERGSIIRMAVWVCQVTVLSVTFAFSTSSWLHGQSTPLHNEVCLNKSLRRGQSMTF